MCWVWIYKHVWNRSSESSNFFHCPSKMGIAVVRDLGNFEILLLLLLKLAQLLFVANCWRARWTVSGVLVAFRQPRHFPSLSLANFETILQLNKRKKITHRRIFLPMQSMQKLTYSVQCIKIAYSSARCTKRGYSSAKCSKIGYSSAQCLNIAYSSAQWIKIAYSSAQFFKIGYSLAMY